MTVKVSRSNFDFCFMIACFYGFQNIVKKMLTKFGPNYAMNEETKG